MSCNCTPRFTANTGTTLINTANPNRDGTGTMGTVFTAGLSGALVKGINVVATGNTTQDLVRFFLDDGAGTITMVAEITVPASTPTGIVRAWSFSSKPYWTIESGYSLLASTENAEGFIITAITENWEYCDCV